MREDTRRAVRSLAVVAGLWLLFSEGIAPRIIRWLYTSDAAAGLELVARERAAAPLSYFLDRWLAGSRWGLVALLAILLVPRAVRSETFRRRHVGTATPEALGAVRILVCAILLVSVLWEDLVSTSFLPRSLADPDGVLGLLFALPLGLGAGLERLAASAPALAVFHAATALLLLLGALGWRTRAVLPLAAAAYLVFGGLIRQYSRFFHTGIVPWYVLAVLCFAPAADGLSLDRRRRLRAGRPVPAAGVAHESYGWARYAVWVTIALPYVEAGLSKLRSGGLDWLHPATLRTYLLRDTLNPMEFDFRLSLALVELPAAVVVAFAAAALGMELAYGLVLVSRRARRVLPAAMAGVHAGILLLQNVLFFDLILLQAVFYDWRPLLGRLARAAKIDPPLRPAPRAVAAPAADPAAGRRRVVVVATILLVAWGARVEFYPLTAMQMYARAQTDGEVEWIRVRAVDGAGRVREAPIAETIGALADARYRTAIYDSFEPGGRAPAEDMLAAVARRHGRDRPPAERIRRFEVELRRWSFLAAPRDPDHGERVASWSFEPDLRAATPATASRSSAPSGRSP